MILKSKIGKTKPKSRLREGAAASHRPNAATLVLMHTDSLNAYAWRFGEGAAQALADRMVRAAREHSGDVIWVSQGWDPESKAARAFVRNMRELDTDEIVFDEAEEEWEPFLAELEDAIPKGNTVEVGGLWYDPKEATGCATYVIQHLRSRGYAVRPRRELLGCETAPATSLPQRRPRRDR